MIGPPSGEVRLRSCRDYRARPAPAATVSSGGQTQWAAVEQGSAGVCFSGHVHLLQLTGISLETTSASWSDFTPLPTSDSSERGLLMSSQIGRWLGPLVLVALFVGHC